MEFKTIKPIFKSLYQLYFSPSRLFSNTNLSKAHWLIFLATAFYGVTGVFERIEQKVIRYNMTEAPVSKESLLNSMVSSWDIFWGVSLAIGILSGVLIWWMGGWFYNLRIRWCGAKEFNKEHGRAIYVISNVVYALPFFLGMFIVTFWYKDYLSFYKEDVILSTISMIFVFWSLIVSYKAVVTNFNVKKWLAVWWFIVAPIMTYTLILFFYTFIALYVKQ
jgi:hypothetical protein